MMKGLSLTRIVLLITLSANLVQSEHLSLSIGSTLRILSYNVRFDSTPDNISVQETIQNLPHALPREPVNYFPDLKEQPWSRRRIYIANDILSSGAQIYGGQELLKRQVDDLQELLGDSWAWVGVGRDDGVESGEYSTIFYRKDVLVLHDWDTFWLTSTPFEISKYPDAGSKRICTTARFSYLDTRSKAEQNSGFTVLNTHLDDQSVMQRKLGASLILHRAKYEAIKTKRPVILTGDFNSPNTDPAYNVIIGGVKPLELNLTFVKQYSWTSEEGAGFEDFILKDLLSETPPERRSGHYATFTDFSAINDDTAFERLDYVFAGSNSGWTAHMYRVGSNLHDDGVYASDHRPVYVDLLLEQDKIISDVDAKLSGASAINTLQASDEYKPDL